MMNEVNFIQLYIKRPTAGKYMIIHFLSNIKYSTTKLRFSDFQIFRLEEKVIHQFT